MFVIIQNIVSLTDQELSDVDVERHVRNGFTLADSIPDSCPPALKQLVCSCWRMDPRDRPSFCSIIVNLIPYAQDATNIKFRKLFE